MSTPSPGPVAPSRTSFSNYQMGLCVLMDRMPFFYAWAGQLVYGEVENNPNIPVCAVRPFKGTGFRVIVNPRMMAVLSVRGIMFSVAKCIMEIIQATYSDEMLNHPLGGIAIDLENVTRLISDGFVMAEHPEFPGESLYVTPELIADKVTKMWEATGKPQVVAPPPERKTSGFYLRWLEDNLPKPEDFPELTEEQKQMLLDLLNQLKLRAAHEEPLMDSTDKALYQHIANKQAEQAVAQGGGPPGSIAGNVEQMIKALKAKIDWKKAIKHFRGMLGHMIQRLSFGRENKYGNVPATTHTHGAWILFAVDDSGSMSKEAIAQGLGEAEEASKHLKCSVMFVDTEIHDEDVIMNFKARPDRQYKVVGGGGTDMREVFRWVERQGGRKPDGIVIFSDGGTPFPTRDERLGIRTLWVCTDASVIIPDEAGESVYMELGDVHR